jgi:deferrochelatase/peroxidase EfeB
VAGQPYSRRIIRRGLPYGPEYNGEADGIERGLFGIFMCGDLEMQFEFLQSTWANEDISTAGLRDTVDPIIGAQPSEGGKFVIRTEDGRDPIVLTIPRLVTTRGSLYLLMPGICGLRHLSSL